MKISDQDTGGGDHYCVIPRTLVFVTGVNSDTGERELLLLKGSATKRLWANRYNGIGGHVEANEDIMAAARREVSEETGLLVDRLQLRGVVNIDAVDAAAGMPCGVMLFVFVCETNEREVRATTEGTPAWISLPRVYSLPLVEDLHELIPLALDGPFFFGHYARQEDGSLHYHFRHD
jgi:8-oxo-dGTP diphosphatase